MLVFLIFLGSIIFLKKVYVFFLLVFNVILARVRKTCRWPISWFDFHSILFFGGEKVSIIKSREQFENILNNLNITIHGI